MYNIGLPTPAFSAPAIDQLPHFPPLNF